MSDQSQKLNQETLPGFDSATSSQGSEGGLSPCNSQDGRRTAQSGREAAPVSLSVSPGKGSGNGTSGTCGRCSATSSRSAALQRSLASRLQAGLGAHGSPEYSLTWKVWDMPSREPICALRASARRISDSGFTGWPTPMARNGTGASENPNRQGAADLQTVAGWATPTARDHKDTIGMATTGINPDGSTRSRLDRLGMQAGLVAGWPTPTSSMMTEQDLAQAATAGNSAQRVSYKDSGLIPDSSSAETESTAGSQLNPAFSLWLMGFPTSWHDAGASALRSSREREMQSSRKSRRSL